MKVQVIIPDKLKDPVGGVGIQLNEIMKRLPQVEWDIIGLPMEEEPKNYTGVWNPIPKIEHSSLITFGGQIAYFAEAIDRKKHKKPDIVHAYDWSSYFAGYYTAQYWGVPLVCTMQLSKNLLAAAGIYYSDVNTVDGLWLEKCHQEIEVCTLNSSDKIIQVSKAYASKFSGVEEKTVVIPNGVDTAKFKKTENFKFPGERPKKAIYIGRFSEMKGLTSLLKAKIPKDFDLIFIGKPEGGDNTIIQEMVKKNVYMVPFLSGQDKVNALMSADVIVMPSLHEPFGIVALEALAAKTILMSSQVGGLSDFLTDENSINCGTTPQSIENAFYKLNSMSDKDKKKMVLKGLETCKEYTWDRAAKSTMKVYKSLVKNKKNGK